LDPFVRWPGGLAVAERPDEGPGTCFVAGVAHPEAWVNPGERELAARSGASAVSDLGSDASRFRQGVEVADDGEVDGADDEFHGSGRAAIGDLPPGNRLAVSQRARPRRGEHDSW